MLYKQRKLRLSKLSCQVLILVLLENALQACRFLKCYLGGENVLILVLLENALQEVFSGRDLISLGKVLILVLLENALQAYDWLHKTAIPKLRVLILVLLENALQVIV